MSDKTVRGEIVPNDELVEKNHGLAGLRPAGRSMARPWEMQAWDSALSYQRFAQFYLAQEPPRSLLEAYRRYRINRGADQERVLRLKTAPGVWQNWAYGRTSQGALIPGALTWAERARAWDVERARELVREEDDKWAERRQQLREVEWEVGSALLERGKRMLAGLLFRKVTEETTSKDGKTIIQQIVYESTGWGERDVRAHFKLGSDLMRRGAGEAPNNPAPQEDWRARAQAAGYDPDVLHETVLWALAKQNDENDDDNDDDKPA